MDPPYVYIEREPLFNIVLASIEPFKRECLGFIYGKSPTKNRNFFHVTRTSDVQLAKKRKNTEVDQSKASKKRVFEIFRQYPGPYPLLGDFHSHPEGKGQKRTAQMSEADIREMRRMRDLLKVCFVIKISSLNKERIIWHSTPEGGLKGSLGKYKFHINAVRLDKNDKEEILRIESPAGIKELNRAIGYS